MTIVLAAIALVLGAAVLPAFAQEIPRAVEQACQTDYERLCRGTLPR